MPPASESPDRDLVARSAGPRRLDDPRVMRAVAHPVRIALLEALSREGPLTATQAGELLDESPGNMSFHLRTLAKYGFVEETGERKGRARPWRLVTLGTSYGETDPDPDTSVAAARLTAMYLERAFDRLRDWVAYRDRLPEPWRVGFWSDLIAYLTPEELDALDAELTEVVLRHRDRTLDRARRPADARPVYLGAFGFPLPPSPSGS